MQSRGTARIAFCTDVAVFSRTGVTPPGVNSLRLSHPLASISENLYTPTHLNNALLTMWAQFQNDPASCARSRKVAHPQCHHRFPFVESVIANRCQGVFLTLISLRSIRLCPTCRALTDGRRSTSTFGTQRGKTQTTSLARRNIAWASRNVARRNTPEMCTFRCHVIVGVGHVAMVSLVRWSRPVSLNNIQAQSVLITCEL